MLNGTGDGPWTHVNKLTRFKERPTEAFGAFAVDGLPRAPSIGVEVPIEITCHLYFIIIFDDYLFYLLYSVLMTTNETLVRCYYNNSVMQQYRGNISKSLKKL